MTPTNFFFAAAIIALLTDRMTMQFRTRCAIGTLIGGLATTSMLLATIRFWYRPDGGPIGTVVGGALLALFTSLFALMTAVNAYKAITGRDRIGIGGY